MIVSFDDKRMGPNWLRRCIGQNFIWGIEPCMHIWVLLLRVHVCMCVCACVCACVCVRVWVSGKKQEREREKERAKPALSSSSFFWCSEANFLKCRQRRSRSSSHNVASEPNADPIQPTFFSSPETYYTHDFWGLSLSLTHTHTHTSHSFSSSVCVFMSSSSSSSSSKEKKKQQPEIRTTARRWGESLGRRRERQKFPSKWPIEHKVVVVQKQVFRFSSDATEMIIYFDDNKKGLDFYCWKKLLLS